MSAGAFIQKLISIEDLKATVMRFPLSVACAVILFIICLLLTHDVIDDDNKDIMRICAFFGCGYFWLGSAKLIAETQSLNKSKYMLVALSGLLGVGAIIFVPTLWGMYLTFIVPALLLLIMVAPYLRGGDDLSFWFFNRQVWFGVVVSYVALFMLAGGASVALFAVHELFKIKIDEDLYADIWLLASLIVAPIYALSWVPKTFVFTQDDCKDPPGLKFLANWISAPMVFVYLLILYAYFARILITGELPNGKLAYLITGFIGAGVSTTLISFPLRELGSPQLRLLHKIFFPALIIPTLFHFYAIWERVSAYGFTEQRYYLLISAVWFAFLALGCMFKKMPIRVIPLVLSVLLLIGGVSAVSVSTHSQMGRLTALLEKNNLIKDDKIVKAVGEIPFEDRKAISSILDYICETERDAMIAKWFVFKDYNEKITSHCYNGQNLTEQLGFEYVGYYRQASETEHFTISNYNSDSLSVDVRGFDFYLKKQNNFSGCLAQVCKSSHSREELDCNGVSCKKDELADNKIKLKILEYSRMGLLRNGIILFEKDLTDFILNNKNRENKEEPLILDLENDSIKARIYFERIYGEMKDGKPNIDSMNFDLLYRLKE